ncbi:hypothetical protein BGZ46_009940 [Entomortierella lignicola]|nr:hypothetical protein BGZ46_009940 [Entomortierella lignicola]
MFEETSISIEKTSSTSNATTTANPITSPIPSDENNVRHLKCPDCKSSNVHEEDVEIICRDCGFVFEDFVFESASDSHQSSNAYGFTRVGRVGRPIHHATNSFARSALPNQTLELRRAKRLKRFEQIRKFLGASGRQSGLSMKHVSRAYFLWKKAMDHLNLRFWDPAARTAVACLYLAAKESKMGISLVDLAIHTNISPYKIGANYKMVKSSLLDLNILAADDGHFSLDEDPWIMLQRVLSIGSADSVQRWDIDRLPREIRDVLGIDMDPEKSRASLRSLLSSAQKCMAIAKDSGLTTGRQPQTLGAACVVVAIEVRLVLTVCPEELYEFASRLFGTSAHTVIIRHKELRKSMLTWARRLPFVKGAGKIKESKLVYYMDDVLKYFGHLQEQNRQLWAMLDIDEDSACDETSQDGGHKDQLGPGGHMTMEDLEVEQQMLQDGTFWASDEDDIYDDWIEEQEEGESANQECRSLQTSMSSDRAYPPSYVNKLSQEKKQLGYINEAKLLIKEKSEDHGQKPETAARQRVDWIKQLLVLGTRSEQEILGATDTTLEYWAISDLAKKSRSVPRSRDQLDSIQLTAEDLDDQEMSQYLRNPSDAGAVLRVMGRTYTEAEDRAKKAKTRSSRKSRNRNSRQGQKRKAISLPAGSKLQPPQKKVRSSKLNLEALRELEEEEVLHGLDETRRIPGLGKKNLEVTKVGEDSGACPSDDDDQEYYSDDGYQDGDYASYGLYESDDNFNEYNDAFD